MTPSRAVPRACGIEPDETTQPVLARIVADACDGRIAGNVALMQLAAAADFPTEIGAALAQARRGGLTRDEGARLDALDRLWHSTPGAWTLVKSVLTEATEAHCPDQKPAPVDTAATAALFDRLAARDPEAACALYALGRADLLQLATASIVHLLHRLDLVWPDRAVLDLGCGTGRVALALAPYVGHVIGIDISTAMLAEARQRRPREVGNVSFCWSSGRDLDGLADAAFDLVLAVDVLPYIATGGTAALASLISETRRVLRPGGDFVAFNIAYGCDPETERAHAVTVARQTGLILLAAGTRDVDWWDGRTFHFRRPDTGIDHHAPAGGER